MSKGGKLVSPSFFWREEERSSVALFARSGVLAGSPEWVVTCKRRGVAKVIRCRLLWSAFVVSTVM